MFFEIAFLGCFQLITTEEENQTTKTPNWYKTEIFSLKHKVERKQWFLNVSTLAVLLL